MAHLVETFRKKTNEVQSAGPRCVNTIAIAWEQWMADVMQDSASHTEISASLGRNVAKPLLEKTFHMKIQSRLVVNAYFVLKCHFLISIRQLLMFMFVGKSLNREKLLNE